MGWSPGLRCLNRYPSLLPGLAVAKTRAHHRDGTGYGGRERSQRGSRGKAREEVREGKERKAGWDRAKGETMERQGSKEKKERESKRTARQGRFRKKRKKEGKKTAPDTALSVSCPSPCGPRQNWETGPVAGRGQLLSARSLSATWVPI